MRSLPSCVAPCAALFATPLLLAQDISLTNGNVQFAVEFNATPVVYQATADVFRADPAGDPAGVLFKTAWAYRLDNDTQEFIFTDAGGQATFTSSGAVGTAMWNNVDSRGLISAFATYTAISTGSNSGAVVAVMNVTNISANPVTLSLFHLADLDLCGAAWTTNTMTPGNDGRQVVTGSCSETAEHFAWGADRWEVGSYTNVPANSGNIDLYTRLEDTALYDLRNDTAPFGPADIRGAFEWQNRVIQPGQTLTFVAAMGHNNPCPASVADIGTAMPGSLGAPTLTSPTLAMLGHAFTMTLGNAAPNTLGILVLGGAQGNTALGDLTLYVQPPTVNVFIPLGPSGAGSYTINIPNSATFCGTPLVGEGVVYGDTTTQSTSGLPVTHTVGKRWVVGAY